MVLHYDSAYFEMLNHPSVAILAKGLQSVFRSASDVVLACRILLFPIMPCTISHPFALSQDKADNNRKGFDSDSYNGLHGMFANSALLAQVSGRPRSSLASPDVPGDLGVWQTVV